MSYILLFFAVLIGALFVIIIKPNKLITKILIAFSGAYLLAITVLELLPEFFSNDKAAIGIYILIGILIQSILENFSKGIEHGHTHLHQSNQQVPWLLFISLSIHAFFEGLPIPNSHSYDLLYAILVHKIPIAIVLTSYLIHAKIATKQIILVLFLFACMSPLGVLFSEKLTVLQQCHQEINGIIIGVFLHISTIILFESSENHKINYRKFIAIVLGFGLAYVILFVL